MSDGSLVGGEELIGERIRWWGYNDNHLFGVARALTVREGEFILLVEQDPDDDGVSSLVEVEAKKSWVVDAQE